MAIVSIFWPALDHATRRITTAAAGIADAARRLDADPGDAEAAAALRVALLRAEGGARMARTLCRRYFERKGGGRAPLPGRPRTYRP